MSTIFGTLKSCIQANPLPVAGGAAALLGGLAVVVYKHQASKKKESLLSADERALIDRQNRIKEVLNKLLITDYYLPEKVNENTAALKLKNQPKPIFNEKTTREIAVIEETIKKAAKCKSALPNLIFTGPPGVGKTMLAQHLCLKTGIGYIYVPPGIFDKLIKNGTHIIAFHDLVKIAESCKVSVYFILDDGENMVLKRKTTVEQDNTKEPSWIVEQERVSNAMSERQAALTNAFLEEFGKIHRNTALCLTTNRPGVLEEALVGRCKLLEIRYPTKEERKQIIIQHLPKSVNFDKDLQSFFNKGLLESMAVKTEGFTGRNLVKLLEDIYACVQLDEGNITLDTVDSCIVGVRKLIEQSKEPSIVQSLRQLVRSVLTKMS